ncbi:MAG: hypothetical protein J6K83_03775 [Bacteroidaceae bacterium]|nr:hypothetical protein [Bacteroidaceae bacterium]
MKSYVFNFLFVTGSLICFAVQNGFSANSSSNVNNHREHVNPALFVENENAIREIYSELGIDWDGEMFVEKNFLETYRVEIDGFIAENKDRINQVYLK